MNRRRTGALRALGVFALVAAALVWLAPRPARASASRALALGGHGVHEPGLVHLTPYLEDDVNVFVNPALIYRYRDRVDIGVGAHAVAGAGPFSPSPYPNPYAGLLFEPGDSRFVFGIYLNRDPRLWGESAALGRVLDRLLGGPILPWWPVQPTDLRGQEGCEWYDDEDREKALRAWLPVDVFFGGRIGRVSVGASAFVMAGQQSFDDGSGSWLAKVGYGSFRIGAYYDAPTIRPEIYLTGASVAAWWTAPLEAAYSTDRRFDEFIGLEDTFRFGGGARARILTPSVTFLPHLSYHRARGQSWTGDHPEYRENEDTRVTANQLDVGLGASFEPMGGLEISAYLAEQTLWTLVDNVGGTGDTDATTEAAPVIGAGVEYRFKNRFALRGSLRGVPVFLKDRSGGGGSLAVSGFTGGALGFEVPLGETLGLDVVAGGAYEEQDSAMFFARADLRVDLP